MKEHAWHDQPQRPPPKCTSCQRNRVAWVKPRVEFCYDCLPGGPFTPPPCRGCGSSDYFSQGRCERCHPGAPLYVASCRGCLAWGVYRQRNWLCWSCRWWRTHYPLGDCTYCGRTTPIGEQRACRLCLEQARLLQEPGRALDLPAATLFGQQLFLANMQFKRFKTRRLQPPPWHTRRKPKITAVSWRQEPLFDIAPDPDLIKQRLLTDRDLLHHCQHIVDEHANKYGWSKRQRNDVVRSLRLLHHLQDTPGAKIKASEVLHLPRYDGNISSTLDVLAAAGLLIDDRPSHLERYFAGKTEQLPPRMKTELQTWLEIMLNGSNTAPRQRLRDPMTVRIHILGITPILTAWVADGRTSLAEITAADVRAALPPNGSQRNWAEFGLRSLFGVLKARKMIFTNPTRGMKATPVASTIPMPLDTAAVREALNSPDPAIALAVALVAFHAITSGQLASLLLSDIVDGRLRLGGRTIPLAAPVRVRLSAWLDHRASTWPNSINPHLFVSRRSAPRLNPVGRQFPWTGTNLRPQALREDRILNEIHATGGDIRALCDLFGLGVAAASRYRRAIEHPDLTRVDAHVPRT